MLTLRESRVIKPQQVLFFALIVLFTGQISPFFIAINQLIFFLETLQLRILESKSTFFVLLVKAGIAVDMFVQQQLESEP